MKAKIFLLAVNLVFALTFIVSCSNDDDENDGLFGGLPGYEDYAERLKYFDPDDQYERCQSGVVQYKCELATGDIWYSPLTHHCCDDDHGNVTFGAYERCGNTVITSAHGERCQNGQPQEKCGDVWYNYETHSCSYDYDSETDSETEIVIPKVKCGNKYLYPYQVEYGDGKCDNGVIKYRCGGTYPDYTDAQWYNYETHYCDYDYGNDTYTVKQIPSCGGKLMDEPKYQKCENGVIKEQCSWGENLTWYNYITQSCNDETGAIKDKTLCQ